MNNIYTFSQTQLKVLLKGSGYSSVVGLNIDDKALDDLSVLNSLNELTKKGFIELKNGAFIMKDDIREMIVVLGNSRFYAAIHSRVDMLPDLCCFFGEKILVCSSRSMNEEYISLYFADITQLFEDLWDQGYFPEDNNSLPLDTEERLADYESSIFVQLSYNAPLPDNSSVVLSAELPENKFIRVVEYYLYNYIVFCDGTLVRRRVYSVENIKGLFFELMG